MTLQELKSQAYDLIRKMEKIRQELREVNTKIVELESKPEQQNEK